MESKMGIEERSKFLQDLKAQNAAKGPTLPLTNKELEEAERKSRMGTIERFQELGFKFQLNETGDRVEKILETPYGNKEDKAKQGIDTAPNIDLTKINVDLEAIMNDLNPPAVRSEGAVIGKGIKQREEWRRSHPRRWRPTKGRLQKKPEGLMR